MNSTCGNEIWSVSMIALLKNEGLDRLSMITICWLKPAVGGPSIGLCSLV